MSYYKIVFTQKIIMMSTYLGQIYCIIILQMLANLCF